MPVKTFFAPTASINTPVAQIGLAADQTGWAKKFVGTAPMYLNCGSKSTFHVPIFDKANAKSMVVPIQYAWMAGQGSLGVTDPAYKWWDYFLPASQKWKPVMVPFDDSFMPPPGVGGDRTICVVDYTNGNVWEYWMVGDENGGVGDARLNPNNLLKVNWADSHGVKTVAMAQINMYSGVYSRTDLAGRVTIRGCGLDKLAGNIRAQEVLDGVIKHLINWTIATPASGAENTFFRPATRLEHQKESTLALGGVTPIKIPNDIALPSGARFSLTLSDFDIEFLLNFHGLIGPIKETMRIILVAMRDYGIMVTETGGWGGGVETDFGPNTKLAWDSLGVFAYARTEKHQQLLDALSRRTDCWKLVKEYPAR